MDNKATFTDITDMEEDEDLNLILEILAEEENRSRPAFKCPNCHLSFHTCKERDSHLQKGHISHHSHAHAQGAPACARDSAGVLPSTRHDLFANTPSRHVPTHSSNHGYHRFHPYSSQSGAGARRERTSSSPSPSTSRTSPPSERGRQSDPTPSTSSSNVYSPIPSTSRGITHSPFSNRDGRRREYQCRACRRYFACRRMLFRHHQTVHQVGAGALQSPPWENGEDPFHNLPRGEDIREQYELNRAFILAPHRLNQPIKKIYNFPIDEHVTEQDIFSHMNYIFNQQQRGYKLNFSVGLILERVSDTDQDMRYFRPAANTQVLSLPMSIWNRQSLQNAIDHIQSIDLNEYVKRLRPNTSYRVRFITQIEYYIYLSDFTLGEEVLLPEFISAKKCIITRGSDSNGLPYAPHMCFFTALAQKRKMHLGALAYRNVRGDSVKLLEQWYNYLLARKGTNHTSFSDFRDEFQGVDLSDVAFLEECFEVSINMYELRASGECTLEYISTENYSQIINLNLYKNHLSLITNLDMYSNRFVCALCGKMFKKKYGLKKHNSSCLWKTKHRFPGGYYKHYKSIYEELEEVGIHVPLDLRVYPFFAVWDMEAMLECIPEEGNKLRYSHRHRPVSCSIASNVEGYKEACCLVNDDADSLVNDMFQHFRAIWRKATSLAQQRWAPYLDALRQKIEILGSKLNQTDGESEGEEEGEEEEEGERGGNGENTGKKSQPISSERFILKQMSLLLRKFEDYTQQMVVLSFNGAKYDTQLIQEQLCRYLYDAQEKGGEEEKEENGDGVTFHPCIELQAMGPPGIIKRTNKYLSISNKYYKFIDITNYLPPGTSYANFLKSFEIKEKKFYFPYEFLTSYEKLSQTCLPPYPSQDWYSSLKDADLLHAEYERWERDGKRDCPPPTGLENFRMIEQTWREKGWRNMKDYLIFYNNCDTIPFVLGAQKMLEMYFIQGVDIFKDTISVPGLARIKLMKSAQEQNVLFPIFNQENRDLYFLFKSQLAAGPSIIFTRHQEKNVTPLRENSDEMCKSIYGYDVNSLYLYCIGGEMPTGNIVRRDRNNGFLPKYNVFYTSMHTWLQYVERREGIKIHSLVTDGREVNVGKFRVDGFSYAVGGKAKIYEFHGCYWHGHDCARNKQRGSEESKRRFKKTIEREEVLRKNGYEVESIWECQFEDMKRENPLLAEQSFAAISPFTRFHRGAVTEEKLIEGVMNGSLSGFLLVDIKVPDELKDHFSDFPPIFANHEVTKDKVGEKKYFLL